MTGTIAIKELLTSIRTIRFVVTILVCCLLIPVSVLVLSSDYLTEKGDYEGRVKLEQDRETGRSQEIKVFRPTPQLMPLFRGVSVRSINSISLNDDPWNSPVASATQSPTESVFPTVDLTFIIGIVLSILALILSFDSLSGEKTGATLRLVLANRLPRSSIVIGKWIGLTVTLLIPFLLGLIISFLIYILLTGVSFATYEWLSLAVCLGAAVVYISLFTLIGLTVSAFTGNPTHSIFIGLAVWGILTVLLPQISIATANELQPIAAPKEIEKNMRYAHNEYLNAVRDTNRDLVEQAKNEHWEYQKLRQKRRDHEYPRETTHRHRVNAIEREYWQQVKGQEQLGKSIALLSPFSSLTQVFTSMAATGPESQRDFLKQAYDYGIWYFDELVKDPNTPPTDERIQALEPFRYQPLSFLQRMETATVPLVALVIMNLVLLVVGIFAFNRYDVR